MTEPFIRPDWWRHYFSRQYGDLYRGPMAELLETKAELKAIRRLLSVDRGPVLDLGCGHGRHLEPLLADGANIIGLDWSPDLLGFLSPPARQRAARGDMRELPFADGSMGGVYLLFNTFGYFADGDNEAVLAEVARVLRPGARLLIDLPSRPAMREIARAMGTTTRIYEGMEVVEHWELGADGKRLTCRGTWCIDNQSSSWEMSIRLYTANEIQRMLHKAGFEGPVEVRPLEDIDKLGGRSAAPGTTASIWRTSSNMVVLAGR